MEYCTHCGKQQSHGEYTLRSTSDGRHGQEFDLTLCRACLDAFQQDNGILVVDDRDE